MKKVFALAVIAAISFLCGRSTSVVHAAPMQVASPSYPCPSFGNGGMGSVSPCTQYIVEVSPARLGGGAFIYQVQDTPYDVSADNVLTVAGGSIDSTNVQLYLPGSTNTFTISLSKP